MNRYVVNAFITANIMKNGAVIILIVDAMGVQQNTMIPAKTLKTEQTPDSLSV